MKHIFFSFSYQVKRPPITSVTMPVDFIFPLNSVNYRVSTSGLTPNHQDLTSLLTSSAVSDTSVSAHKHRADPSHGRGGNLPKSILVAAAHRPDPPGKAQEIWIYLMMTDINEARKNAKFSEVRHETLSLQLRSAVGGNASLSVTLIYY